MSLNNNEIVGRIWKAEGNSLKPHKFLYSGDLLSGSQFGEASIYSDVGANLKLKDIELYEELLSLHKKNPILIEMYVNRRNQQNTKFNLIYFCDEFSFTRSNNSRDMSINMFTWDELIEENTMVEHTKYYEKFPKNSEGEAYTPDFFNQVYFKSTAYQDIIKRLHTDNFSNPVYKVKGRKPTKKDSNRKPACFGGFRYDNIKSNNITYYSEKKSFREIREALSNLNSENIYQTKVKIEGDKYYVYYTVQPTQTIDARVNLFSYETLTQDFSLANNKENFMVESSDELDFEYYYESRTTFPQWKRKEIVENATPEKGDTDKPNEVGGGTYMAPLKTKMAEIKRTTKPEDIITMTTSFEESDYYTKYNCGQKIIIKNFGTILDGAYRINKITSIFEESYVSTILEDLERISD